jgi:hypothetical protein
MIKPEKIRFRAAPGSSRGSRYWGIHSESGQELLDDYFWNVTSFLSTQGGIRPYGTGTWGGKRKVWAMREFGLYTTTREQGSTK